MSRLKDFANAVWGDPDINTKAVRTKRAPVTHDYTRTTWGHNYYISKLHDNGNRLDMLVIGDPVHEGDYLILPNECGDTRYQVASSIPKMDPDDMYSVVAVFAPRTD